jgi:hypothetical protein
VETIGDMDATRAGEDRMPILDNLDQICPSCAHDQRGKCKAGREFSRGFGGVVPGIGGAIKCAAWTPREDSDGGPKQAL